MNLESTDFRFFIECDNSPFVLFGNSGKILYLNNAAEILLGYVSRQELYDITVSYAPRDFGSKTTRLELQYEAFSFYALTVAYQGEDQICLRLYHKPRIESGRVLEMDKYPAVDINILLEANITFFKLQNNNSLSLLVDQDLPPCRIDQNQFSKLLRKVMDAFRSSDSISISLKLLVGEYVIIREKREQLVQFYIEANERYTNSDEEIRRISRQNNISCTLKELSIRLQIPFIQ
ncbi:MAG: hypothetical protein U9Q90_05635 [Campylobacterota bacterium]|nr:hypothetical protein [Campylobacterota bacterium]